MRHLVVNFKPDLDIEQAVIEVPDDYEVAVDELWLFTPRGIVAASAILSAFVAPEEFSRPQVKIAAVVPE